MVKRLQQFDARSDIGWIQLAQGLLPRPPPLHTTPSSTPYLQTGEGVGAEELGENLDARESLVTLVLLEHLLDDVHKPRSCGHKLGNLGSKGYRNSTIMEAT